MSQLSCSYLGLNLDSPFIAASSPLTADVARMKELQDAGIGAVVLKSVFEEQIEADTAVSTANLNTGSFADADLYFSGYTKNRIMDDYLTLLESAKKELSVPVIASLNCLRNGNWYDYAKRLENLGADALELNLFVMPADARETSADIEAQYLRILSKIVRTVSVPVSVKLGSYFTGMAHFLKEASETGVKGIVLFNRYYNIDFDIDRMTLTSADALSAPNEYLQSLRWIALMSKELNVDFSATTGIHTSAEAVKMILAGARTVQLCSVLLKHGPEVVTRFRNEIADWMTRKEFRTISDFCGLMAQESSSNPQLYERHQYIKFLSGV